MLDAVIASALASSALLIGGVTALRWAPSLRVIGLAMALGAGLLISVITYSLVLTSYEESNRPALIGIGLALGAIAYFHADRLIGQRLSSGNGEGNKGLAIAVGALFDGVPESIVIGATVVATGKIGVALVIAAFIANFAESLGATPSLVTGGFPPRTTMLIWTGIVVASIVAASIGYVALASATPDVLAMVRSFAAGAVFLVLANALIPESYEYVGKPAGLMLVLGFSLGIALELLH